MFNNKASKTYSNKSLNTNEIQNVNKNYTLNFTEAVMFNNKLRLIVTFETKITNINAKGIIIKIKIKIII